jgi:hypothetical protein
MTGPAVVSGPGAMSQRTDAPGQPIRSLPNPDYGEAQAFEESQKAAPLASAPGLAPPTDVPSGGPPTSGAPAAPSAPAAPPPGMFDLGDPGVPMTAGAALGAGPNTLTGLPGGAGEDFQPTALRDALAPYASADPTGILQSTIDALSERGMW